MPKSFSTHPNNTSLKQFYMPVTLTPQSSRQIKKAKEKAPKFRAERSPQDQQPAADTFFTSMGIVSGTQNDSFAREFNSAYGTINISESKDYVKKFTYPAESEDAESFKQESSDETKDAYYQTAYHGSPYNFDAFNLQAIGTGEGAQAHGYGLYFALDEEVAQGYKEKLTEVNKNPVQYKF